MKRQFTGPAQNPGSSIMKNPAAPEVTLGCNWDTRVAELPALGHHKLHVCKFVRDTLQRVEAGPKTLALARQAERREGALRQLVRGQRLALRQFNDALGNNFIHNGWLAAVMELLAHSFVRLRHHRHLLSRKDPAAQQMPKRHVRPAPAAAPREIDIS
jgi:hypothetical protein